jgi:hypothetical protein
VTDTNGLDVLIAWAAFIILLTVLAALVLRGRADPVGEAERRTDGSPTRDHHNSPTPPRNP